MTTNPQNDSDNSGETNRLGQPYNPQYEQGREQGANRGAAAGGQPHLFTLAVELLSQKATNAIRTVYAVIGVLAVVMGAAVLFWPVKTLAVVAIALGVYFLFSGVFHIVSAIVDLGLPAGWRALDILVGVILCVGGVIMLKNSVLSGQALVVMMTVVIGIGWIVEGVLALAESWRLPGSGWAMLYAVISILAGIVVLMSPVSATLWLIIFVGVALVVIGVSSIVRAFVFGRSARV